MVSTSKSPPYAQYKQKSRGCPISSSAAAGLYLRILSELRFWLFSGLDRFLCFAEAILKRLNRVVCLFLID
jgi:hypothetical protein